MSEPNGPPSLSPVLVTGGCGFIGFHIITRLLESDPTCQIHVIDIAIRNQVSGVTYHTCDIASPDDVEAVMREAQPRTIFHVASPDSMVLQPSVFQKVNVEGTGTLMSAALKVKTVRAFVNTSTSSVIHDNLTDLIDADENLPILEYPAQKRVYTLTKAVAETEILAANRKDGDSSMLTVSLRPALTFGERDTVCMGKIVNVCRKGKAKIQFGDGKNEYDFVYAGNLADAQLLAAQALVTAYGKPAPPLERRVDGQIFNITNDERFLFWEFQRQISAAIGFPVKTEEIRSIPLWLGLLIGTVSEYFVWLRSFGTRKSDVTKEGIRLTTITRTLNGSKAKRVLGYTPKVGMLEGIQRGAKWFVDEAKAEEVKKRV